MPELPADITHFLRSLADHPLQDEAIDDDEARDYDGWSNDEGGFEFENDEAYTVAVDAIEDARSLCKKHGIPYIARHHVQDEEVEEA